MAWVFGGRDSATFQRLYDKVNWLKDCRFYTDSWDAFSKVLPSERHIIGKIHTVDIERDNSNTRHNLGRFARRTKIVSKSAVMVNTTIKLWCALTSPEIFERFRSLALSIYK